MLKLEPVLNIKSYDSIEDLNPTTDCHYCTISNVLHNANLHWSLKFLKKLNQCLNTKMT